MDWFLDNIYELCIGVALVFTTIFNRRKLTADEIKQKNSKAIAKLEQKQLKEVEKLQKLGKKIEEKKEE